jgi:four helix bundle protein
MQDYANLKVWQKGHRMVVEIYRLSSRFPKEELYGLVSQIRRCAVSIPANIAEGCGRDGDVDFARFLRISMGSANELEYYLLLSRDLGFLDTQKYTPLRAGIMEIKRMLNSFIQILRTNGAKQRPRASKGLTAKSPKLRAKS